MAEAGAIARRYFRQVEPEWKGHSNPVTVADREIEQHFVRHIRAAYPEHGILGEEYGAQDLDRTHIWAIDPIDGTRMYVEGLPSWSISLALLEDRVPVFGMIHIPLYDDWIYTDGDDVICNGSSVKGRLATRWDRDSYIFWRSDAPSIFDLRFKRLMTMGATASHMAYTARGASLATITHDSFVWDIAAGAALIYHQGGELRYHSGELLDFRKLDLMERVMGLYIAAHPDVTQRLIPLITRREAPYVHPDWE